MLKALGIVSIVVLLAACSSAQSLSDYTRDQVGQPISGLKALLERPGLPPGIVWTEITYRLVNGDWVYVETYAPGMFIHWEVNPQGIIVGYAIETVGRGETTRGKDFKGEFKHPR